MTKKEKRNLLIAAAVAFVAIWLVVVAFGEVLGVSPEARDTVITVASSVGALVSTYIMKKVIGIKDENGNGIDDALEDGLAKELEPDD